jgi:hypothetical protein
MKNTMKILDNLQIATEALKVAASALHEARCLDENVTMAFTMLSKAIVNKTIFLGRPWN